VRKLNTPALKSLTPKINIPTKTIYGGAEQGVECCKAGRKSVNNLLIIRPLTPPNIESELSYAYLHAVASQAGMTCREGNRHEDNNGIDAQLTAWLPFVDANTLTEVDIKVQLKATLAEPVDDGRSMNTGLEALIATTT
jgi:hypothetical protein